MSLRSPEFPLPFPAPGFIPTPLSSPSDSSSASHRSRGRSWQALQGKEGKQFLILWVSWCHKGPCAGQGGHPEPQPRVPGGGFWDGAPREGFWGIPGGILGHPGRILGWGTRGGISGYPGWFLGHPGGVLEWDTPGGILGHSGGIWGMWDEPLGLSLHVGQPRVHPALQESPASLGSTAVGFWDWGPQAGFGGHPGGILGYPGRIWGHPGEILGWGTQVGFWGTQTGFLGTQAGFWDVALHVGFGAPQVGF